ncbi:hypothetical protein [Candidatus Poriferisodalis sp.]|uniref:hypothetical protein n=1 Tax=Candidatus Poriferisodalis sp. TaxID=3101277 RepID=UPI003B5B87C2
MEEQPAATEAADGPDDSTASRVPTGGSDDGRGSTQPAATADHRTSRRRPFPGQTAAITIIAALIASMTLAAVTAFNTLRSDILSVRTETRDEIGSLRTELHDFRTEVGTVLLDHAERLARIEALLLNSAVNPNQQS